MKLQRVFLLAAVLVSIFVAIPGRSQSSAKQPTSTIMGTLLDVADARIAHAKVRIENSQFKWAGETDDAGDFSAVVPAGTYRIYADANGFRRFESPFLRAKPDTKEMVNLHLEVLMIIDTIQIAPKKHP